MVSVWEKFNIQHLTFNIIKNGFTKLHQAGVSPALFSGFRPGRGKISSDEMARGFRSIGYHYYITKDGMVYPCRPETEVGAHARHYNAHSIGICYEGGLDEKGKPADTRTPAQKDSLEDLLYGLSLDYPDAEILGHRDLPWVRKSCPCFDVKEWLKEIDFHL